MAIKIPTLFSSLAIDLFHRFLLFIVVSILTFIDFEKRPCLNSLI